MKIRIWGSRGSLPTPGKHTVKYGGNTTCIEIRLSDNTLIIIDAGSGLRLLGKQLIKEKDLKDIYLVLTHAHWDHLMGFPFFMPAYFSQFKIHVRGGYEAKKVLEKFLSHQMEPPFFPVKFNILKAKFDYSEGEAKRKHISNAEIIPIKLNHPDSGFGYKIVEDNKQVVILTDNELDFAHNNGLLKEDYIEFSKNADLLIHDAQYDLNEYERTKGWGHSTFDSATDLAIKANVKRLMLFHHDPDHTDDEIDKYTDYCNNLIKQSNKNIECFAAKEEEIVI